MRGRVRRYRQVIAWANAAIPRVPRANQRLLAAAGGTREPRRRTAQPFAVNAGRRTEAKRGLASGKSIERGENAVHRQRACALGPPALARFALGVSRALDTVAGRVFGVVCSVAERDSAGGRF